MKNPVDHHRVADKNPIAPLIEFAARGDDVRPADGAVTHAVCFSVVFKPFPEVNVFEADPIFIESPDGVKVFFITPEHTGTHAVPHHEWQHHQQAGAYAERQPFRNDPDAPTDISMGAQVAKNFDQHVGRHAAVGIDGDENVTPGRMSPPVPDAAQAACILDDDPGAPFFGDGAAPIEAAVQYDNMLDGVRKARLAAWTECRQSRMSRSSLCAGVMTEIMVLRWACQLAAASRVCITDGLFCRSPIRVRFRGRVICDNTGFLSRSSWRWCVSNPVAGDLGLSGERETRALWVERFQKTMTIQ